MARPQKKGLDYFPIDVNMDIVNDETMMLEAKYGTIGFAIMIKLFMKIYQKEGYYIEWTEKTVLLFSKRINVINNSINSNINLINEVINDLVKWGVFDETLYNKYNILTSKRIQETYFEAVKKRKDVEIIEEYVINGQLVNSNINSINSVINPQRKEKKSKEEKSKEKIYVDYDDLKSYYNSFEKLKTIRTISKSRQDKIRLRIKEQGLDAFKEAIKICNDTPFLHGENDRGWVADIDWLIENDTNIVKVLEKKYGTIKQPEPESEFYKSLL